MTSVVEPTRRPSTVEIIGAPVPVLKAPVPWEAVLQLHDTATGRIRPLTQRNPGEVSIYLCGPTVYDLPHLGHGRQMLVYDVLRRYLEWCGIRVRLVSNVTDIDDNIITRAAEEGRSADEVVAHYEAAWWDAVDALEVERPTVDPHATQYVDRMVALIEELMARGLAYETDDGVYFRAERVPDYGLLAGQPLDALRAGARVDVAAGKESPLDFALWKRAKPGEPTWPSPWGPGRPGWHTECVVMSLDLLGDGFDLHAGGLDLRFPHHENERAQAEAWGRPFARHWMHHGFVEVAGQKMSKSLGNFTSLADFLARADARAYRLLVLRAHYRSPLEVTEATVTDAEAALDRLDAFARRAASLPAVTADAEVLERFRAHMDDDLDTPGAAAVLFEAVRAANAALDAGREADAAGLAAAVREMAKAVGLALHAEVAVVPDEVRALARERDAARGARDWATADAIRARLQDEGWVVEDTPDGTSVRRGRTR